MNKLQKPAGWALIISYFVLTYLLTLHVPALWSPDELRYAEISRELLATRDWVVPHFNGLFYFEKPIMGYWLNAIAQMIFGQTNFAVRFMSSLSVLGSALCIMFMVRRVFGRTQAYLSVGVYLSFFIVIAVGTFSVLDSFLTFWLTLTFVAFYMALEAVSQRQRCLFYLLAGMGCGGAFLTKGFLALALPFMVVVAYAILQHQFRQLMVYGWLSVASALTVTLPWAIAVHLRAPDFWHYFFWVEHIHRFFSNEAQHVSPVWFFVPVMLLALMPWTFLTLPAFRHLRTSLALPAVRYTLLWAVLPFIFFSLSRGKLATYILPCMAPLAILITHGLIWAFEHKKETLRHLCLMHAGLMMAIALVALIAFLLGFLPFGPGEGYKLGLLVVSMLLWSGCIVLAGRCTHIGAFFVGHMLAPVALFTVIGFVLPDRVTDAKQPQWLIEKVAPHVDDDTVLVADYPTIMSAFNWYLRRDDVYLLGQKGEVSYGLGYADSQHRFIEYEALGAFILEKRQHHAIAVEFRTSTTFETPLPPHDRIIELGPYKVLFFDRKTS
ncbi:phospholipid carrier-dependent glycosyltransferase [Halomonas aquamarina]|uniref:Phospholipid carrier-dependent glycosyltransferase n=1 Tax=Vreelandella aquamarina TaxID=77097 RepID=A0ACC5VXT1_9GAMM|nr:phospholipid carrier-dependent glycosyltransferase [Halomonas aquamarina]MBZ5488882.1 phospholipid carrier-dependent glycosyltransferase [Halomonas aquamarina]